VEFIRNKKNLERDEVVCMVLIICSMQD